MSRMEWALSGVLALLLVVVLALALIFWSRQQSEQANLNNLAEIAPQTARQGYDLAYPVAAAWAADAQLASATGSWAADDFRPASGRWSYLFYSPARQKIAMIAAQETSASLVYDGEAQNAIQLIGIQQWTVDSPDIVAYLMENGGQEFIDTYEEVTMELALETYTGLTWKASLVAGEAAAVHQVQVDASRPLVVEPLTP